MLPGPGEPLASTRSRWKTRRGDGGQHAMSITVERTPGIVSVEELADSQRRRGRRLLQRIIDAGEGGQVDVPCRWEAEAQPDCFSRNIELKKTPIDR